MKNKLTHKEKILKELELCYDKNFKVPAGLYIPLGNRVLVKECSQEEHKTAAGIILSGSGSLQHAKIGIVYRIGEGVNLPIKIGMKVAYNKHAQMGIVHDGVSYTDLPEYDIFSVIPADNYLMVHVPDTEENRRSERIDTTKKISKAHEQTMDKIQNS